MKEIWKKVEKFFGSIGWLLAIISMIAVGSLICHYSINWSSKPRALIYPVLNLVGILFMIVPAWITAMFYCLRGKTDPTRGDNFFGAFWIGSLIAFFYSSSQGYISGSTMAIIWVIGTMALGLTILIAPLKPKPKNITLSN